MNEQDDVTRFPLQWPIGWKRAAHRKRARFRRSSREITFTEACAQPCLLFEPAARKLDDPGVAVYFTLKKQARCLACDVYDSVASNVSAIAAHIDALRQIDRYGVGTMDQAFAGYAPRLQAAPSEWWIVLGIPRTSSLDAVDAKHRSLMREAHPDAGGSPDLAARLNEARDAAHHEIAGE